MAALGLFFPVIRRGPRDIITSKVGRLGFLSLTSGLEMA